ASPAWSGPKEHHFRSPATSGPEPATLTPTNATAVPAPTSSWPSSRQLLSPVHQSMPPCVPTFDPSSMSQPTKKRNQPRNGLGKRSTDPQKPASATARHCPPVSPKQNNSRRSLSIPC